MFNLTQLKKYISLFKNNKKVLSTIAGMLFAAFRYMAYQTEYNKAGWKEERILHHADNVRCQEQLESWKSQDSIRSQQIWDRAFNNARERILQPAIDSISKL